MPSSSQHPDPAPPRTLTDLSPDEMTALVARLGEKPYRAKQLLRRAWRSGAHSFDEMTELPKAFREKLAGELAARALVPAGELVSADGDTRKLVYRTWDSHEIETVWMSIEPPGETRPGGRVHGVVRTARKRLTVCVSSQIGCAFGCAFCASGRGGLVRSLRASEIAEQVVAPDGGRPTHVVIMGMGEPLSNYDQTLAAIRTMNAPWGPGIGARRITVSTLGFPKEIRRLAREGLELELAISLHAPDDETRERLCPGAKATVRELLAAARDYSRRTGRLVTFEYALVRGVNDAPAHARALASKLGGMKAKVNVIPLNPVSGRDEDPGEGPRLEAPTPEAVSGFAKTLGAGGVNVTVRRERGSDVDAACGQLRWRRLAQPSEPTGIQPDEVSG